MGPQESGTPDRRAWLRAEVLLKEAKTERAQGRYKGAVAKCEEALALAPGSPEALETLGDIHVGAGHFRAGMEAYQKVLEADPTRAGVEEKLARASLSQLGFQRQMEYGERLMGRGAQADLKRRSQIATCLSVLAPGIGQFYNEQHVKALAMLVAHVLLIVLALNVVANAVHQGYVDERVVGRTAPPSPYGRPAPMAGGLKVAIKELKDQRRMWQVYTLCGLDLALYALGILDAGLCALRRE